MLSLVSLEHTGFSLVIFLLWSFCICQNFIPFKLSFCRRKKKIILGLWVSYTPLKETLNKNLHRVTLNRCFLTRYFHQNPHPPIHILWFILSHDHVTSLRKLCFYPLLLFPIPLHVEDYWGSTEKQSSDRWGLFTETLELVYAFLTLWLGEGFERFFWWARVWLLFSLPTPSIETESHGFS